MTAAYSSAPPAFVAVDWGTSSFRAWLMAADGAQLAETRGSEGMLHCASAGFAPVLHDHIEKLGAAAADLPVLICGMAGARQGWVEAPYLHTPTRLDALHDGAIRVDTDGDVRILPGLAQARADRPDVMRGEETQLLGVTASDFSGIVCIPGTHSKWIRIEAGAVVDFATYMTGELFAVLSQHSILMHAVAPDGADAADGAAFRAGLATAQAAPTALSSTLFRLRAAQLLGFEQRSDGAARLSGLLIGSEIADARAQFGADRPLRLIGAGRLGHLYRDALIASGFTVNECDAEQASRRGLVKAARQIWGARFS
ncbi:2-keto-3-deoxygalactonate kinase [Bradyrhizobium sp. ORS 285]|uniref:2-dehydro-3-deoxygalactonokinase n=1 Tax=Bradyrhizobium sp. ORS 285 TaxID=115808 RepID=UPI00024094FF|nr:2-dehydro-3-deoxygalactonokinase [Bradyrhizobium sp. ORS 285]CCD87500.1 2-dehydro-3-deoxygalactonokinase (2-keto-3-deoxy-galactonokinase) (2-oxo-3-deoxygalactonate kinase) [Bradyrhizobium sp. ORS 285]SMX60347.1 2-keto-3-deoxygalactonate kinase [Bradyrhizobium sp. ORS 285]